MKDFVVERIEGTTAVCEDSDGNKFSVELKLLPEGVAEQQWISIVDGQYVINHELTEAKRSSNADLYSKLRRQRPPEEPSN